MRISRENASLRVSSADFDDATEADSRRLRFFVLSAASPALAQPGRYASDGIVIPHYRRRHASPRVRARELRASPPIASHINFIIRFCCADATQEMTSERRAYFDDTLLRF